MSNPSYPLCDSSTKIKMCQFASYFRTLCLIYWFHTTLCSKNKPHTLVDLTAVPLLPISHQYVGVRR